MRFDAQAKDLLARLALAAAVYLVFALQLPSYHSTQGVAALMDGAVLTGLVAIGVGLTMIAGEMDLSVGSMAALAGILAVKLFALGLLPAILIVTLVCGMMGAVQGWCISRLNINSMVFTVGTLIGLRGLTLMVSGEKTAVVPIADIGLTDALAARLWIFSPLSLVLFSMAILAAIFATRTIWGREIFAIGGGRSEARAAGVPIRRPIVLAFTASAGLAGLAGALLSLRAGSASPLGFEAVLLEAVAACLIGGIALSGGRGTIVGIMLGLFAIRFLVSGIAALGAPFWAQSLATGALLIVVILAEALSRLLMRQRTLAAHYRAAG